MGELALPVLCRSPVSVHGLVLVLDGEFWVAPSVPSFAYGVERFVRRFASEYERGRLGNFIPHDVGAGRLWVTLLWVVGSSGLGLPSQGCGGVLLGLLRSAFLTARSHL